MLENVMEDFEAKEVTNLVDRLAEVIVGHSVVEVMDISKAYGRKKFRFVLDNGTTFKIESEEDCCAFGELMNVERLAETENVITSIKVAGKGEAGYGRFDIFLLSAMEENVYKLDGKVDGSNGYYSFGFNLTIEV